MTFISMAHAADAPATDVTATTATTAVPSTPQGVAPPSQGEALLMNVGMVVLLGIMFYLLLIRPQQKRYKAHNEMISKLDKGVKVLTQGGLVGVIEKVVSDHEVVVDFGNGVKMNVMRSYILGRYEDSIPSNVANDDSKKTSKQEK